MRLWLRQAGQHVDEIGCTPNGNRVPLERASRVEGPGPHVFVYDKDGNRYRVQVASGRTAQQIAEDLVSGSIDAVLSTLTLIGPFNATSAANSASTPARLAHDQS